MSILRHADVESLLEIAGDARAHPGLDDFRAGILIGLALTRAAYDAGERDRPAWHRAAPATESLRSLGLTRRQAEVLVLLSQGRSNKEIAARLGISRRTVEKHLEHVFRRLGVATRSAATARAWAVSRPSDAV